MIRLQFLARRRLESAPAPEALREAPVLPSAPRRAPDVARMMHLPPRFSPADPNAAAARPHTLERELTDYARRAPPRVEGEADESAGPFA